MKRGASDRGGCNQRLKRAAEEKANEQVQSALASFLVFHAPFSQNMQQNCTGLLIVGCRYAFSVVIHLSLIVECRVGYM